MSFNHRVCKEIVDGYEVFSVREVYYKDNGEVSAVTQGPVRLDDFEDREDLASEMLMVLTAFQQPTLDLNTPRGGTNNPLSATG